MLIFPCAKFHATMLINAFMSILLTAIQTFSMKDLFGQCVNLFLKSEDDYCFESIISNFALRNRAVVLNGN